MAYSSDTITALAQLASATSSLVEKTGEDKKAARDLAINLITAQSQAKLQSAMAIEQAKFQQAMDINKESLIALRDIQAESIKVGEFTSEALDQITKAGEETPGFLGGLGPFSGATAGDVKSDYADFLDSNEELIKSKANSIADIIAKKSILGSDSPIVQQTLNELKSLRDGVQKSTDYVKTQQEFDLDTRPEGIGGGAIIRTIKSGFGFLDDEKDLLKKSKKQLRQYDALIDLLEN
jgi:hypothetical protein